MLSDEARVRILKHDVELYLRGETPTELEFVCDESAGIFGLVGGARHKTSRLIWHQNSGLSPG
jgi:hypothetical protein